MKPSLDLPTWDPFSERLIAFVRLVLAAGALVVVWIDPTQPTKYVPVAYASFIVFVVYSAVAYYLVRTRAQPWLPVTTQIVDLLWVPPVLYFTEAANSPFFPFFVVFALTAGIRWGRWGAWAVSVYSLIVYGYLIFVVHPPTPLDLNNSLMRMGNLLIVGFLGGYLTEYRRQRESELKTLHTLSEATGTKYTSVAAISAIVEIVTADGLADSVVGVLREPEEGEFVIVRGAAQVKRLSRDEAAPFFAAAAARPLGRSARVIQLTEADAVILRFAEADEGLAYPIRAGDELVGAIFLLFKISRERSQPSDEFLSLLLRHVIPQLETLYVLEHTRQARVIEERRRIARDLHDSFLQVLAALGLRLDVLCSSAPGEQHQKDLVQAREIVAREQKRVRDYIAEMREPLIEGGDLRETIERTTEAFQARTQIAVDASVPNGASVPPQVLRELAPLLREALTNIEKHARASRVAISALVDDGQLVLTVQDDGVGITEEHGTAGVGASGTKRHGLASMRERAQLLGGTFTVKPAPGRGTVVTVSIPLPALV